ncbi:hypothetical protein GF326_07540 [Candidatus Bathyarchaeota archaeon]|nr:hypothetical protein [Candidatus Bathyarchaeota archaeon]
MHSTSFLESSILLIKSRKEALGLWLWCSIVAALIVGRGFPPIQPTILSITATFFTALAVYVYNDIVDLEADQENTYKNTRPLATGKVSKSTAKQVIIISSIIGLSTSLLNNTGSFLFNALYFTVFALYSYPRIHLKKRFLVKETVISTGMIMIAMSANYAIQGAFSTRVFFGYLLFAIFAFCAMPTGFDSTDVEADKLQGVNSIASNMSFKQRIQLAMGGMILIMTLSPLTYQYFGYNILMPISITIMGVTFIKLLYPVTRNLETSIVDEPTLMKTRKIILGSIFIICICVILGSLNLNILST